jgi:glycosyltransferase involved in cell wall biosynthesis
MSTTRPRGRILLVSYWFPPYQAVASLRMGKFAKHLLERGWDVRVISAGDTNPPSLTLEIPKDRVTHTGWSDVDRLLEDAVARLRGQKPQSTAAAATPEPAAAAPTVQRKSSPLRAFARRAYQEVVRWPDNRVGWLKPALAAGDKLIATWRPDVIYATSPPVTSLIAADRLSRKHNIPWVAEFRDLWSDHPYYEYSNVRRFFERRWDQQVLTRASAIVTVSPIWQPRLAARYGRKAITAMNGFVVEDFPETPPVAPETSGPLRIVYTGHIYHGHRDPTPLFQALRRIGATPSDVVVEFVGSEVEGVRRLAADENVTNLVRIHEPVPYRRSLELQLHADILLHLQWCDPKEEGTIAGKIFDYLGARRPILGIALEDCVVAKLIHERKAGLVTNDVGKIADQLRVWIKAKQTGGVAPLPASASEGLDRAAQFEKVEALLSEVIAPTQTRQAG